MYFKLVFKLSLLLAFIILLYFHIRWLKNVCVIFYVYE